MVRSSASLPSTSPTADPSVHFVAGDRVAVLLPLPVVTAYDYRVPGDLTLASGDMVEVPLGRRFETGVVWGPGEGGIDPGKLKDVVRETKRDSAGRPIPCENH